MKHKGMKHYGEHRGTDVLPTPPRRSASQNTAVNPMAGPPPTGNWPGTRPNEGNKHPIESSAPPNMHDLGRKGSVKALE